MLDLVERFQEFEDRVYKLFREHVDEVQRNEFLQAFRDGVFVALSGVKALIEDEEGLNKAIRELSTWINAYRSLRHLENEE